MTAMEFIQTYPLAWEPSYLAAMCVQRATWLNALPCEKCERFVNTLVDCEFRYPMCEDCLENRGE